MENETVLLTQTQIAELFERDRTVITKHINIVFKEKELGEKSNVQFLHIINSDKPVKLFSLDVKGIIYTYQTKNGYFMLLIKLKTV